MKTTKTIAVITPVYHGIQYIGKLIHNVDSCAKKLIRVYPEATVEYLLVNDSPDNWISSEQEQAYKKQASNCSVSFYQNAENSGIHQTRVHGLNNTDAKYICFLDQDDELHEDFLLSQYKQIGKHDIIVGNGVRRNQECTTDANAVKLYQRKAAQRLVRHPFFYVYGTDMIFSPGQCLIRKAAIPQEWVQNIMKVNGCDDFLLWLLMMQKNCSFGINEQIIYTHVETKDNYSSSSQCMTDSFMEMCQILEDKKLCKKTLVNVLRRRYQLKNSVKNSNNMWTKAACVVRNVDIILVTLFYKMCGYH